MPENDGKHAYKTQRGICKLQRDYMQRPALSYRYVLKIFIISQNNTHYIHCFRRKYYLCQQMYYCELLAYKQLNNNKLKRHSIMRKLFLSLLLCCLAAVGGFAQDVTVTDITVETEGQLGYKVLEVYNAFDEVKGLRISGPINDED